MNSADDETNGAVQSVAPAVPGAPDDDDSDDSDDSKSDVSNTPTAASTDHASQATSSSVETTASSPQTLATRSSTPLASATASSPTPTSALLPTATDQSSRASTTSQPSSTSFIAAPSSSTTSQSSSTISTANLPSATVSPSHHTSAKLAIGLGVPLGLIFAAIIGWLIMRHRRHKQVSRLRHHGTIAAAGLYPAIDEGDDRAGETTDQRNMTEVESGSESLGLEKNDVPEIQGTEIPAYSRELIGSAGVRRQELPSRHGSVL